MLYERIAVVSVYFIRCFFFFSSRRRHTRLQGDWSSDVALPISAGRMAAASSATRFAICSGRACSSANFVIAAREDRKSVVEGKSVDLGGRRIIKKKKNKVDDVAEV